MRYNEDKLADSEMGQKQQQHLIISADTILSNETQLKNRFLFPVSIDDYSIIIFVIIFPISILMLTTNPFLGQFIHIDIF